MTLAYVIVATLILIIGLFAVIVERTNERDEARETARLSDALDDLAATPTPLVPFDSLSKAERFIRPDLHIIPPQRDGEYDRLPLSRDEWAAIEHETAHVEAWGDES